ncbi:uncharacterized protein LOC134838061 [Culicoides brevitarsis]|uniref:uncharacterized protein LOC134838061 n=1 Tax=Culicoides brevitarsis TaxID=469753 RepID=UPI00307B4725
MTNLQEKIFTNDEVIKKVSLYINREIDKKEIMMKSFLKVLLAESLQMEIHKLKNIERQELYRETAKLIAQYRVGSGNERTWSAFSCHLINSLKNHKLGVKLFCEMPPNVPEKSEKEAENEVLKTDVSKNEAMKENLTNSETEPAIKREILTTEVPSEVVQETQMVQIPPEIVHEIEKIFIKEEKMDVDEKKVDSTNTKTSQNQLEEEKSSIFEEGSSRKNRISSIESNLSTASSKKSQKNDEIGTEKQLLESKRDETPPKTTENEENFITKNQKLRNSRNLSTESNISTSSSKKSHKNDHQITEPHQENDENPMTSKRKMRKSRNISIESTSSTTSNRQTRSRSSISKELDEVESKTPQRRNRRSTNSVTESNISTENASVTSENSILDQKTETEVITPQRKGRKSKNSEISNVNEKKKTKKISKKMIYNVENLLLHNNPKLKLALNCSVNKICNYSFSLHSKTLSLEMHPNPPNKGTQLIPITDVDISKLLYWPGVGIRLSLPEIEIFRFCASNATQNLIPPFLEIAEDSFEHTRENDLGCFKSFNNEGADLSTFVVEYYLEFIIAASKVSNFSKQQELETVIKTFLEDLKRLPFYRLKTEFSFFCASNKYYRDFEGQTAENDDRESLNLREIYNPEVVICIKRCSFEKNAEIDTEAMNEYFKKIILDKNPEEIEKFNNMLNQGFALQDLDCADKKFTGPLKVTLLCDHLGMIPDKEFYCVKCMFFGKIGDLAERKWVHECQKF